MLVEQDRLERLAHVPLDMVGGHAQENVGAAPMIDRSETSQQLQGLSTPSGTPVQ